MDSHFINFDGRSVHDMIELLLAASGDPEAIARLQQAIQTVDAKFGPVNDELATQNTEMEAIATTGGVKNIVPNEGADTFTQAGITFTKNADGSVTANGTATGTAIYRMKSNFTLPMGKYVITGSPNGAADDKFFIQLHKQGVVTHRDTNNPLYPQEWDETGETVYDWYGIAFLDGTVADNLTFYPMIRPQGTSDVYVEGMYPNSELYEDTGWILLEDSADQHITEGIFYRKKNGIVYVDIGGEVDIALNANLNVTVGTLPAGFRPTRPACRELIELNGSICLCVIFANGKIVFLSFSGAPINSIARGNISYPV